MSSVDNKRLVQLPVYNNSCIICISYEITDMLSVINLIYCNTPIDNVYSHATYFDVFVWWSWYMPEEVSNITTKHILGSVVDPYGILTGKSARFFFSEFTIGTLVILSSVLFRISIFPLSKDSPPPVVWTMMFMLWYVLTNSEDIVSSPYSSTRMNANFLSWLINIVTSTLRISRSGFLIPYGN